MSITLPAAPAALPADTYFARHRVWWEQCDALHKQEDARLREEDLRLRAEAEDNRLRAIAANEALGKAQQATAEAMLSYAAAQRATADAIWQTPAFPPERLPTKAELVFDLVKVQPQSIVLTPGIVVKGAMDLIDAYVAKHPDAVRPVAP